MAIARRREEYVFDGEVATELGGREGLGREGAANCFTFGCNTKEGEGEEGKRACT